MRTSVQRWGNSLALRIPRSVAQDAALTEGAEVELRVQGKRLVVARVAPHYRLADLLNDVDRHNVHAESWGDSLKGREVW